MLNKSYFLFVKMVNVNYFYRCYHVRKDKDIQEDIKIE